MSLWDGHKLTDKEKAEKDRYLDDVVNHLLGQKLTSRLSGEQFTLRQFIVSTHEHAAHSDGVKYTKPKSRKS